MPDYYLRLEGMNLAQVIDDTDNLSTRRGGSLMVLEAAHKILGRLPSELGKRLSPLATAASIGLFAFHASDDSDAESVRSCVAKALRCPPNPQGDDLPLQHATFVVDCVLATSDLAFDIAFATARNRWRQLAEPTLSFEGLFPEAGSPASPDPHVFCVKDRIRPAVETILVKDNVSERVSASVAARHRFGRSARQTFYQRELKAEGWDGEIGFTDDLVTLAALPRASGRIGPWQSVPTNTDGKIAVFYVDGNRFGSITHRRLKQGVNAYKEWSQELLTHHRRLLSELLHRIEQDDTWRVEGKARLETLLWGGDEITWVVPAWKGWELAEWFFSRPHEVQSETLSYGCGLVFAHVNTPIKNLTTLAHSLAELAKEAGKSTNDHRIAYEVMESMDDITGDLAAHRKRWIPADESHDRLLLAPSSLSTSQSNVDGGNVEPLSFWTNVKRLAGNRELPIRQLYLLCQKWRQGGDFEPHRKRLETAIGTTACRAIESAWCQSESEPGRRRAVAWLHVLQMLPYMTAQQPPTVP